MDSMGKVSSAFMLALEATEHIDDLKIIFKGVDGFQVISFWFFNMLYNENYEA